MKQYISRLKDKASKHKTLIQNFSYLSVFHLINMLIPLITYPYLIRVLGKETYGLVVFAQAILSYLVIFVSFGFNISATREISLHRDNKEKIKEIVSSILIIKSLLFLVSIFALWILITLIPIMQDHKMLFVLSLWACLFEVIFPTWFFQGIEQMKYVTYILLISRIIFLGLIFVFIHKPNDYLYVPIINGIGALVAGFIALYMTFKKFKVQFRLQPYHTLKYYFWDSFPVFISNVSISLFVSTNKVIIGAFLSMKEVAYYDLAEKITTLFKIPQSLLSQSIFPYFTKHQNFNLIFKIFRITITLYIVTTIFVFVYPFLFIIPLGGKELLPSIPILRILIWTIPFATISGFLGIQLLLPLGMKSAYINSIIFSSIVYFFLVLLLWFFDGITLINLSFVTLLNEVILAGTLFYFCVSKSILKIHSLVKSK